MAFGAKTVTILVKDVSENASMTALEAPNNASIKMNSSAALEKLCEPLKKHKSIKRVVLSECEITDDACKFLAGLLRENHVIEELILEKNKIGSEGAKQLADALAVNKGLRTLSLMGQLSVKNFGEDTLERFITMYHDNITLTKIQWRLESRKSFMLTKLQTRNNEIKKRQDKGEDFNAFLPDHMKAGAAAPATEAAPAAPEAAAPEAAEEAPATRPDLKKRTSVEDMEEHVKKVESFVGSLEAAPDESVEGAEGAKPAEGGAGYTPEEPPKAPEPEAAVDPKKDVSESWAAVHESLEENARVPREAFVKNCKAIKGEVPDSHKEAFEAYVNALFDTGTALMLPAEKNDLGKHCFGYATLLVPEFYCEKPKDGLGLAAADKPEDSLASTRAELDADWEKVEKNDDGRVTKEAFTNYFVEKYKEKLVPESEENYRKFLEQDFTSSTSMMLPAVKDSLGGHCFRYGGLMAGEFYFDAAKDAATGCGCSAPVADVLGITK